VASKHQRRPRPSREIDIHAEGTELRNHALSIHQYLLQEAVNTAESAELDRSDNALDKNE
jgi:hypothetical protein